MRFFACILSLVLLCPSLLKAGDTFYIDNKHLYVASDEESEETKEPSVFGHLNIEVSGVYSHGIIQDSSKAEITRAMSGARGEIGVLLSRVFRVGIEGEHLWALGQGTSKLSKITRDSGLLVLHTTFTPNTNAKLYLLAGGGKAQYRTRFQIPLDGMKQQTTVWMGGVGWELPIAGKLYFAAEYRVTYDTHRWENFILSGPKTRREWSAGIGYSF